MTSRDVRLAFLGDEVYALLQDGDIARASRGAGVELPQQFITTESWLWPVFRAKIAGHAGFHAAPDARGMVEIGYTVLEDYRRRGYATATVGFLLREAASRGARVVRASVSPQNEASLSVVRRLGFVQVGQQVDDEDGLELVFERDPVGILHETPPSR